MENLFYQVCFWVLSASPRWSQVKAPGTSWSPTHPKKLKAGLGATQKTHANSFWTRTFTPWSWKSPKTGFRRDLRSKKVPKVVWNAGLSHSSRRFLIPNSPTKNRNRDSGPLQKHSLIPPGPRLSSLGRENRQKWFLVGILGQKRSQNRLHIWVFSQKNFF